MNSHQTEGDSQLLIPIFTADLGTHGHQTSVNKVLDGTYVPPEGTSIANKDFLTACQSHENIDKVTVHEDICKRYRDTKKLWNIRRDKNAHNIINI